MCERTLPAVQGTIRDNLDPLQQHSDRELIGMLKHVGLWDILCGLALSQSKFVNSRVLRQPLLPRPFGRGQVKPGTSFGMGEPAPASQPALRPSINALS